MNYQHNRYEDEPGPVAFFLTWTFAIVMGIVTWVGSYWVLGQILQGIGVQLPFIGD